MEINGESFTECTVTRNLACGAVRAKQVDADPFMRLAFSAASEMPVERWFGTEILEMSSAAANLERVQNGSVPLLFNHDWGDPIGMVDVASLADQRLQVEAHLFNTARAGEVGKMIDGGLKNVSIGYRLNVVEENTKNEVFTATDWSLHEISIVSVPADYSVGIGRSGNDAKESKFAVRIVRADGAINSATAGGTVMGIEAKGAETRVEVVADESTALEMEASRVRCITNMARANNIDDGFKNRWIGSGAPLEKVSDDILAITKSRSDQSKTSAFLDLSINDTRQFSLSRAVLAIANENWTNAGFEAECSREIAKRLGLVADPKKFFVPMDVQKRDLTVATGSAGGNLVQTSNQSFIDILRNLSVAQRMGVTNLSGLQGSVTIPKLTTSATPVWLANEAATITESTPVFGQLALTPKTVGAYNEISRQLLLQSSPTADSIVSTDLARVLATAVDLAVIAGSGAAGQPLGIIGTAGIGSVTGTAIAYAGILEFQTDTAAGNALFATSGYITTPLVAGLLKARVKFASTASPIWEGPMHAGNVDGYQAMASQQVPTGNILFGDFTKVILAEWGVLQVEVNPYANFQAGIVGIRAMYTIDVGVRYAAAFSLATGVT